MRSFFPETAFAKRLYTVVMWLIMLCWGVVLLWLSADSLRMTCEVVGKIDEKVLFYSDSVWKHIVVLLALLAVGVVSYRYRQRILYFASSKKIAVALMLVWIGYTFYILSTQVYPTADQKRCFAAATSLLAGDYSPWEKGGYAYIYPNQNGLILFLALLQKIFGVGNYLVVQFLNILAAILAVYYLAKLCKETMLLENTNLIMLLLSLYMPMMLYITFNYGTLLGLACALSSMYYQSVFLSRKKWYILVLAVVLMACAVQFKSNYLIFVIASAIIYLYYAVSNKSWKNVVAFVMLIAVCLGMSHTVSTVIEHRTGLKLEKGMPTISWVLIGLEESHRAPGWYSSVSMKILETHDYDTEKTTEEVSENLKERVHYFLENPQYTAEFFEKKVLSMWNEPTFQSLWIQQVKNHPYEYPAAISSLLSEKGRLNRWYTGIFDYVQTWVYLFCLLYIVFRFKKVPVCQLLPAIVMMGGFLFHLVWEGKSQYTVVYFFLLIPYAVKGFYLTVSFLSQKLSGKTYRNLKEKWVCLKSKSN